MKKSLLTISLGFGICSAAFAGSLGPLNNSMFMSFNVSDDAHNYFYCEVKSNKVKYVHMENHNCLISGFDKNGVLDISNALTLTKLNHTYFDVIDDSDGNLKLTQNVFIKFDGDDPNGLVCHEGKGGRVARYGLFWGHG